MKRVFVIVLLLGLSCWCTGCPSSKTEKEVLHVFNWTDYIGKTTISTFEKSVNAKVIYDNYSSNEELIAKLEGGGADYDIIFPSGYAVEILIAKKMLSTIDHTKIPNLKYVMAEFSKPGFDEKLDFCVPYTWSTTGIGYNLKEVMEEQTKSWAVLFNERYRGKILMLDDMRACMGMALKSLGYSANSSSPDEISKAKEKLLKQKPLVHVYTNSNIPDLLGGGEVKLAYGWSGDILQATGKNKEIKYSIPNEGTLMYVDYICVPAMSKKKDLAYKFINHILDPQVSLEIASTIRYAMTNSGARDLADGETKELWSLLEKAPNRSSFEFIKNIGSALDLYDQAWQNIKAKQ